MRMRSSLIFCFGAAAFLALLRVLPAYGPGSLGKAFDLRGKTLFERLSPVSAEKFESAPLPPLTKAMILCPADRHVPELSGECVEPVVPERSVSLRLIIPGGREHKSSPSSGSTIGASVCCLPSDRRSDTPAPHLRL